MKVSTRTLLVTVAVTGLIAGATGAVLAGHQFSDVSNSHPFHDEISAIADAGVTTGFNDGTFRPGNDVSRMAMAAFMQRGFGRVGGAAGSIDLTPSSPAAQLPVQMEAGATGDGNGFVNLSGTVTGYTDDAAACPCEVAAVLLRDEGDGSFTPISPFSFDTLPGAIDESGFTQGSISVQSIDALAADTTGNYVLHVQTSDTDVSFLTIEAAVTAQYLPFDTTGNVSTSSDTASSFGGMESRSFSSSDSRLDSADHRLDR